MFILSIFFLRLLSTLISTWNLYNKYVIPSILRANTKKITFILLIYMSDRAVTPGNSLPSNNSKLAPPPVLMWLTLSPRPA